MNIVTNIREWQDIRQGFISESIGFIPTMGNLHAGHLSLCERAKNENDLTVVSIFVNPTQFDKSDDFKHYPRTLQKDIDILDVDYLFLPDQLYPDNYEVKVVETSLSLEGEGKFRPGHLEGMLTVVLKLLNLVRAQRAYFGEKDYQQLLLIKKMVSALFIPTEIIACETVRDANGLALSSRNSLLSETYQDNASLFPQMLASDLTCKEIAENLRELNFKVDYILEKWQRRLGAVWLDGVRLIDNIKV